MMTAGVDVWLNTPAAADGSLRHQRHEGGAERRAEPERARRLVDRRLHRGRNRLVDRPAGRRAAACFGSQQDAASLYDKLEQVVMPLFYRNRDDFST